eukprot:Tamp_19413.p1 GENE.Tamp_19413~~Tamp_19413.p1  ORF type:complete len:399 (-),score=80.26 Tamp_19413:64-1164(-)
MAAAAAARGPDVRSIVYSRSSPEGIKIIARKPVDLSKGPRDKVLCRVACAGLNPVDAKGLVGDKLPAWMSGASRQAIEGCGVGFDFAGTVIRAPPLSQLKEGDAIFGTAPPMVGTLSEEILVPLDQIAPKPPALSFSEAAALPLVGLTAIQSLKHDNGLSSGQHLLLIGGSGGVGHVACQVAKALGASVTAICSDRNSLLVRELGADRVVDYSQGDAATLEGLRAAVGALGPFHLCLDTVSSLESKDANNYMNLVGLAAPPGSPHRLLRGKYIKIGGAPGEWMCAGLKRTIGLNLFSNDRELFWVRFPKSVAALEELTSMVEAGKLRPRVSNEVAFKEDDVREAFAKLHARRVVGKQVVRIADDLR